MTTATTRQPISSQCPHPENKMCAYIRAASRKAFISGSQLVLAAPDSFLSAASVSQTAAASDSHFFMKLVSAAPASFFSVANKLDPNMRSAF